MKKRICVLLILMFTGLGLFACGKDPYSQVKMTVSRNELYITMSEDSQTHKLVSEKECITVQVSVPKSLSDAIVLPKYGDRYGDEYVTITIEDAKNGTYSLVFEGLKTGYSEIPIKTKDGNVTETIAVTVDIGVSSIAFKTDKTLLAQEGSKLDLTGNAKNYIDFTPSDTSLTRVVYYVANTTSESLNKAMEGRLKDNVLDLTGFEIKNEYLNNNNECIVYLTATALDAKGEPISEVYTKNVFLPVKIIKPFEFPSAGFLSIGTGDSDDNESYSLKSRVQPAKDANSVHYDLSFASPDIPKGEVAASEIQGVSQIMFGGRLRIAPGNNDYKISIDKVDSEIVEVNSLTRVIENGDNAYVYFFQITPKKAGTETLVFKIDYTGGSTTSAETGEFDGLFTKYIYLTINVKNLAQQSNLEINDEAYSKDTTIMVFHEYAVGRGAKLKIYDSLATDMVFKLAVPSNAEIKDENGDPVGADIFYPNGSVFYIRSAKEVDALEYLDIVVTSRLYDTVVGESGIQYTPNEGYTYSKIIKLKLQHLSSSVNLGDFGKEEKTITIKNSSDLEPTPILRFDNLNIDAKQIISQVSLTNSNSGRVSFGTGANKNIVYFTPNFKLEKDFYVSSTNVTLTMVTGASKTATINVELDYVIDNGQPLVVYEIDESNEGYFASWINDDEAGKDSQRLTLDTLGSSFNYNNNTYTFDDEREGSSTKGRRFQYKYFNQLVLSTKAVVNFNVYRLFIYNGEIHLISVNDGVYIETNDASVVSWQRQSGQVRTGTKVTTDSEPSGRLLGVILTVRIPNGISEGKVAYFNYTVRTFVFEKITNAKLKTNSFTIYDATNLKTADYSSSLATLNLAVKSASGETGEESVKSYGDLAYGNLFQNYSMIGASDVFALYKGRVGIKKGSLMEAGVALSRVTYTDVTTNETRDYYLRIVEGGIGSWYGSVTDAVLRKNEITDPGLISELEKLPKTTVNAFRAKFTVPKGTGEDPAGILSYIYGDGALTVSYLGIVKQFNNSFEANFTVKIYNPTKSTSLKTWVDKEMGLYLETDAKIPTVSTRYEVLPTNTFNKNIFVEIANGGSKGVIKFTANGKTGYYQEVNDYLSGVEKYHETEVEGKKVVVDENGLEVSVLFEVKVENGVIYFTYTNKDESGKLRPGKFICTVVPIDQVSDGVASASKYASVFNINVADGSQAYKYQIRNSADLEKFLNNENNISGKYYQLATDIILNKEFVDKEFVLKNNLSGLFEVAYDGKPNVVYKYSIFGLRIKATKAVGNVGLFASVGTPNLVLDYLNIESASVSVETDRDVNVGILIAVTSNNLTIKNCKVSGSITVNVDKGTNTNANVNVGAMIGKASGALTVQGAPSESTINNNNINANVSIKVVLAKDVTEDASHVINAGGIVGYAEASENKDILSNIIGFTGIDVADVNVISRITAVKLSDSGTKTTTNYAKNVNIGGVIGKANYAKIDNVVVYPILAGYTNVGGVIGQIGFGEITNTQVQLLYNLNMKNIIAGYNYVGGIVGYADLIEANPILNIVYPLTIDYCYVRSYTSRAMNDFTDGYFDVVNDINENYYGGVVLLNDQSGENRYMGGLIGAVYYTNNGDTGVNSYNVQISNSYFNSDLASNVNNKANEKVGGFVGFKEEAASGEQERLKLNFTDCYFDGDTLLAGNLKLIYGSLADDNYTEDPNVQGATLENDASTYVYSHIGNNSLAKSGDYTIWRETESSRQLTGIKENYVGHVSLSNVYAKINGTLFGTTSGSQGAIRYSGLTTKLVETNILVFKYVPTNGTPQLRLSVNKRELQSSHSGDVYTYFELPSSQDQDKFPSLYNLSTSALHDMLGYGFISEDITKDGDTITARQSIIKNIIASDIQDTYNCSTRDQFLTILNVFNADGEYESLEKAVADIRNKCKGVKSEADNYKQNSTSVKYSETIYPTIIGFTPSNAVTERYPVFEIKINGTPYYLSANNTERLFSKYEVKSPEGSTDTWISLVGNSTFLSEKGYYFSMPKHETKVYNNPIMSAYEIDTTFNGDKIDKVLRIKIGQYPDEKYDFYLYSGTKAYQLLDCIQQATHEQDEIVKDGKTYKYLFEISSDTLAPYVYYQEDGVKTVYTHFCNVNSQDAVTFYLYESQGAFVAESAKSNNASGAVTITIKGVKYTLTNGVLVDEDGVEFQPTSDSRFYVNDQLEVNSDNKILSNEKILEMINSINQKNYKTIQEMFNDLGFNNFDGEIYAPSDVKYYFSHIEGEGTDAKEVWYTDLTGDAELDADTINAITDYVSQSNSFKINSTDRIYYVYDPKSEPSNPIYYYYVGGRFENGGLVGGNWYKSLKGTAVTDEAITDRLAKVTVSANTQTTGWSYTILPMSYLFEVSAKFKDDKWYYGGTNEEVNDTYLLEKLEENKSTDGDGNVTSKYDLKLYKHYTDDGHEWTYDSAYENVAKDSYITSLIKDDEVLDNKPAFSFSYNTATYNVTIDNNGAIKIVSTTGAYFVNALGGLGYTEPTFSIVDGKLIVGATKDGKQVELTFNLQGTDDSFKWVISDKVNNGLPVLAKLVITQTGANKFDSEYELWFDTLATLSLTVHDFVSNGNGYYYEDVEDIQYQGHIMYNADTVVLMYNAPLANDENTNLNTYLLSYGVTDNGYFVASINGKVLEISGVKIDKDSASQIVITSSDSDVASLDTVEQNVSDKTIKVTVHSEGETILTFYNLKDDGINIKLNIKVVKGFTNFEIKQDGEPSNGGTDKDVDIKLQVGKSKDYNIGFVNTLNGNTYPANTSGYQVRVLSVDGNTSIVNVSSSMLLGNVLINGEMIGKTYDFDYTATLNLLALDKYEDGTENAGRITLQVIPFVIVSVGNQTEKLLIDELSKNVVVTLQTPALSVDFTEIESRLMAQDTKEISVVITSNNGDKAQSLTLNITGVNEIVINPAQSINFTQNLVVDDGTTASLLSLKFKSYSFVAGEKTAGKTVVNRHTFTLVVGLDMARYLTEYKKGVNPLYYDKEFTFVATDGTENSLTSEFKLTIAPNPVNSLESFFYPVKEDGAEASDKEIYSQSNVWAIVPGKTGMMKIEIAPEYNNVLAVELELDSRYLNYVEICQYKPNYIYNNDYIEYTKLDTANTVIGNRLVLWNTLVDYEQLQDPNNQNNTEREDIYKTQGEYYVRFAFRENMPQNSRFNVNINLYDRNRDVLLSEEKQIFVEKLPEISVTVDEQKSTTIGKGEYLKVNFDASNINSDIDWKLYTLQDGNESFSNALYTLNGNTYTQVGTSKIDTSKDYYIKTSELSYGTYTIEAKASNTINNTVYSAQSKATFKVVKVAITSIREVDEVEGVVTINNGTTKTLKASVTLNAYARDVLEDDTKADYDVISQEYERIIDQISNMTSKETYPRSSNWGIASDSSWVQLGITQSSDKENGVAYPGFIFLVDEEFRCKIRARVISNIQFKLSVQYYYDENGEMYVVEPQTSPIYYDTNTNTEYYLDILEHEFTLTIKDNSNEDHPNPINSQDELAAMQEGVNYILQRDIELISWRPIDFKANYLDGNGFTITIKSFDLSDEKGKAEAYVGLFRTIAEGSTVKNLNINISELLRSKTQVNAMIEEQLVPNIDLRATEVVYFGCLSATNEGIVENVRVLNYILQSDLILYVATTRGYYQANDDYSTNTSYIGGLVGQNTGVIADCMLGVREGKTVTVSTYLNSKLSQKNQSVEGFSIWGGNNLAGVSATNSGTISNTYTSRLSLKNTARVSQNSYTAGFVGQNTGKVYSCAVTTINSDLTNFRADSTKIESSVPTAGFVYKNTGKIEDCYSNIKIVNITISTAGFVYENEGEIVNAYTTTKNSSADNTRSHGLFVYVKPMKGTLKNCYYAIVNNELGLGQDIDMEILKVWDPAIGLNITAEEAITKSLFDGFTFASNEASLDGVWLFRAGNFPRLLNCESIELYSSRELTSAPTVLFRISETDRKAYSYDENFEQLDTVGLTIDNNTFYYSGIEIRKVGDNWTFKEDGVEIQLTADMDSDGNIYYKYQSENATQNGKDTMFNYTYTKYNPGSKNNPILVATAEEFARYIVSYSYEETINGTKYYLFGGSDDEAASKARYIKIVQDLDFSDKTISSQYTNENGTKISISDITFNGVLLGNSMSLSSIYLTRGDKVSENENWGIFAQVGLPSESKTIERTKANAFVFNLKLNYREVSSENSRKVGILAGTIQNATITKVDIAGPKDYKESDIVKGKYLVGGLAGYIGEGANISEITTTDVRVSSAYITAISNGSELEAFNLTDKSVVEEGENGETGYDTFGYFDDSENTHRSQAILETNGKIANLSKTGSDFNSSYAGAIAGAIVGHSENDFSTSYKNFKSKNDEQPEPTYKLVRNAKTTLQNVTVSGGLSVTAMVAGGMFGYAGGIEKVSKTDNGILVMKDMFLELTDDDTVSQGIFGRAYSGGIVGYGYRTALVEARVEHSEEVQDAIDTRINTISSTGVSRNDLFVSQLGNVNDRNIAIGGIAGITRDAIIVDTLSKVNVVNEYSYIAGGFVGQANGSLYMAYDYTIGNVDAGVMIGGLIGYKTYVNNQPNDLYMFNCIALNVWDAKVKNYITQNGVLFTKEVDKLDNAGNKIPKKQIDGSPVTDEDGNIVYEKVTVNFSGSMPEIGNQRPVGYEFSDTATIDALKYLGSVIGRASYLGQKESRTNNYVGISQNEKATAIDMFKSLSCGTRENTFAGASFTEYHPTFYNNNIFHVVSSTYGKVIHTGDIAKDNYTSRISDDKLNLSAPVGVKGNAIDLSTDVAFTRLLGNQYYISQITGDYLNSYPEKDASGQYISANYNYKNEFSLNWGFVMDISEIEHGGNVFNISATGISTSYVWYVESLKYLPKHGYNINSNVQIIENATELKEALTFGYSDKIYKINLESFVKKENGEIQLDASGKVLFDMPTIDINRADINLSNCVFIVDPFTHNGNGTKYDRFTITFKKSNGVNKDGIYNSLSGCTFVNIDFVIDATNNDTVGTNSTGGYFGLFANELLGSTFTNCTFEINTGNKTLDENVQVFGLLAGRVNRAVFNGTTITISKTVELTSLNESGKTNVTHIGGVFGFMRDSTLDAFTANLTAFDFGTSTTRIYNNSICYYAGGFAGRVEGGTISNLTINLNKVNHSVRLEKVTTDKGGGINFGGVFGGISQTTMNGIKVSNITLAVDTVMTLVQHNNMRIGVFAGHLASSTVTGLEVSGSFNYTTKKFTKNEKLYAIAKNEHIGIVAGYASSNVMTDIKTYSIDNSGNKLTSRITYTTISDNITQKDEVQSAINIGGVMGSNEFNTLNSVISTTNIIMNVPAYNNFCTTLRVGGIAGYALGSSTTLNNAVVMGNIQFGKDVYKNQYYIKTGASIGGVYGQSGRAIMSDVAVYSDISYLDPGNIKTIDLNGTTLYYRPSNMTKGGALVSVFVDLACSKTLVSHLDDLANDLQNQYVSVTFGKATYYGVLDRINNSHSWYTDAKYEISLKSRLENSISKYTNIINTNFYIGGVIGSGSNATRSSEFTNIIAMSNITATGRNGEELVQGKTYNRVSGFMYGLKSGPSFENVNFVAELDPASASSASTDSVLGGLALPYVGVTGLGKHGDNENYFVYGSLKYMPIPKGFSGSEDELIALMTVMDNTQTTVGGKLNPNFVTEISKDASIDSKKFYVFNTETIKFGAGISIGNGAVVTSTNLTGENKSGEVVCADIAHGVTPIKQNYGTISNILFMYQGANNDAISLTGNTTVLLQTNYGYLYNVAVATKIVKDTDGLTNRDLKITKTNATQLKFSLIGANYGGIYKSGTSIVFNSESSIKSLDMSFFVFDNYGTIKECYTTSKYNGKFGDKNDQQDSIKFGFMVFNNDGTIENCEIAGRFGNTLPTSSNIKHQGSVGTKNCWVCKDGNPANFETKGDIVNWNKNKDYTYNEGFPYILGGIKIKSDPYGGKYISINSVQEFTNYLTYLNAFADTSLNADPTAEVGATGVKSKQKLTFNIQSGAEIPNIFYLNNYGTINGEIIGLTLYNPLVRTNSGNASIEDLTIKKTTMTSTENSSALVCAVNKSGGYIGNVVVGDAQNAGNGCTVTVNNGAIVVAENYGSLGPVRVLNSQLIGNSDAYGYLGGVIGKHYGALYYNNDNWIATNLNGELKNVSFSIYTYKLSISGTGANMGLAIGSIDSTANLIKDEGNVKITKEDGTVVLGNRKDIIITNSSINGKGVNVGGAIGSATVDITTRLLLDNVTVNITALAANRELGVGGVIGWVSSGCKSISSISALAGSVTISSIGDKNQRVCVGGVVGESYNALNVGEKWICTNDVLISASAQGYNYYVGGIAGSSGKITYDKNTITYAGSINAVGYKDTEIDPYTELKNKTIDDIYGEYGPSNTGGIANMTNLHSFNNRQRHVYAIYGLGNIRVSYMTGNISNTSDKFLKKFELKRHTETGIKTTTYKAEQKNVLDEAYTLECEENLIGVSWFGWKVDASKTYYSFYSYKFNAEARKDICEEAKKSYVLATIGVIEETFKSLMKNIRKVPYNQDNIYALWASWNADGVPLSDEEKKGKYLNIATYEISDTAQKSGLTFKGQKYESLAMSCPTAEEAGLVCTRYAEYGVWKDNDNRRCDFSKDKFGIKHIVTRNNMEFEFCYSFRSDFVDNIMTKNPTLFESYRRIVKEDVIKYLDLVMNSVYNNFDKSDKRQFYTYKWRANPDENTGLHCKEWDISYKQVISTWKPFTKMDIKFPTQRYIFTTD